VLRPQPLEVTLGVGDDRVIANFAVAEAGVVELHVSCSRYLMKVILRIQQIGSHLSSGTLSTQNTLSYALPAQLSRIPTGIVGGVWLFVEWLVNSNHFFLIILKEICPRSALSCKLGIFTRI